jgi:hypothetical protein
VINGVPRGGMVEALEDAGDFPAAVAAWEVWIAVWSVGGVIALSGVDTIRCVVFLISRAVEGGALVSAVEAGFSSWSVGKGKWSWLENFIEFVVDGDLEFSSWAPSA